MKIITLRVADELYDISKQTSTSLSYLFYPMVDLVY